MRHDMHVMGRLVRSVAQNCIISIKELHYVLCTVRPNTITVRITGNPPWLCDRKTRVVPNHAYYACKRATCNPISPRQWPGSPPTHAKFWAAVLIQVRGNLCNTTHPRPPAACLLPYPLSTLPTSVKNTLKKSTLHAECPSLFPRPLQYPVRFIRHFD